MAGLSQILGSFWSTLVTTQNSVFFIVAAMSQNVISTWMLIHNLTVGNVDFVEDIDTHK
jgi:hypothetical protein